MRCKDCAPRMMLKRELRGNSGGGEDERDGVGGRDKVKWRKEKLGPSEAPPGGQ